MKFTGNVGKQLPEGQCCCGLMIDSNVSNKQLEQKPPKLENYARKSHTAAGTPKLIATNGDDATNGNNINNINMIIENNDSSAGISKFLEELGEGISISNPLIRLPALPLPSLVLQHIPNKGDLPQTQAVILPLVES